MPIVGKLRMTLTIFSLNTRSATETVIIAQFRNIMFLAMLSPTSRNILPKIGTEKNYLPPNTNKG
uniref:Uncharacterized protein n=1 Tax=Romanomermis culicivorax TaxID=13658 RepID=A0A915I291_ROMCU